MLLIVRDKMKIDFVGNRIHLIHPDDNPVSNSENTAVPLSDHPVILLIENIIIVQESFCGAAMN